MYVLHVTIRLKLGSAPAFENLFSGPFSDSISKQPGYRGAQLLRANESDVYVLSITFENKAAQQAWVATDLHTKLWTEMEKLFEGFSLTNFTQV